MSDIPKTPSFRLDGKRALVAGGTSGIGRGAVSALAEFGADVTVAARSPAGLSETHDAMIQHGLAVRTMELDLADVDAIDAKVGDAGPFDILVNSAGVARHGPAVGTAADDFDLVMAVNLRGAYFLAQAVAKGLIKDGRPGSLITMSSQMGHVGGVDRSVYCASKHAVEGFTKAMAIEWGQHGIRVNTICPTFIRTPLTESTFQDPNRVSWITEKIKLGRIGQIEDVMGAVVFLASDASSLVTGTALTVDGGWTAG